MSELEKLDLVKDSIRQLLAKSKNNFEKLGITQEELVSRITNLVANSGEATQGNSELIDIRVGSDGSIYATAGDAVRAVGYRLDEFSQEVSDLVGSKIPDGFIVEDNMLYLARDGEIVSEGVELPSGGGGGGGGSSSTIKLKNESLSTSLAIAEGETATLKFNFSSIDEDGNESGSGTLQVYVNNILKLNKIIPQGSNELDVTSLLSAGNNSVRIKVTDSYGLSKQISYSIAVIALSITSTFDESQQYDSDVSFRYIPVGAVEKIIHFELDGTEIATATTSSSGRQMTQVIPVQSHGTHLLRVWITAEVNGISISSNILIYDIMFVDSSITTPIIASPFAVTEVEEGTFISIPYTVYDPKNLMCDVTLEIISRGTTSDKVVSTSKVTVDRTKQTWNIRKYPVGNTVFRIKYGSVAKEFLVKVKESAIQVDIETNGLEFYLDAEGKSNQGSDKDSWESNGYATQFTDVNFLSNGWDTDSEGNTRLKLAGDARAYNPFQIFKTDSSYTGRTIEFDLLVSDVQDQNAVVVDCMSGDIGLQIMANKAVLKSELSEVSAPFGTDAHIRLSFVIDKSGDGSERMIMLYINGIASGAMQYPDGDNFSQVLNPVGITMGSNLCTTYIYSIAVYDYDVTKYQILNNFIAGAQDPAELAERYHRNDIFDEYSNIVIDKLPEDTPYLIVESDTLPQYKGDKKKVSGSFHYPMDITKNFTFEGAEIDVQGTSSAVYKVKNLKFKFKGGFVDEDGTQYKVYSIAYGGIGESTFTFKADVASSEGTNNVMLMEIYNLLNPYRTPPQQEDDRIRQTIGSMPIVMFQYMPATSTTKFIGKYNFNNDKGTPNTFGFDSTKWPLCQSWEFRNNTSNRMLFKSDDFDSLDESGEPAWLSDFEARYPDGSADCTQLKRVVSWVCSTDTKQATGKALANAVTYAGVKYTKDTAEYRLAKFKNEFEDYFIKDAIIFYFLFTEVFLMVDSRAKNAFLTTWDGIHWLMLAYDGDTAIGINNEGALVYGYSYNSTDTIGSQDVFNGKESVLWLNVEAVFADDIKAMYKDLRSNSVFSAEGVISIFDEHQSAWSEAIFNEDGWFKYIEPLISDNNAAYLDMLQGSKKSQRDWWLKNRFVYEDSKYNAGGAVSDAITFRLYTPANWNAIEPNSDITITPAADHYVSIKYGSYLVQKRATAGEEVLMECPMDTTNDTETYIYSAGAVADVGDLAPLYIGYCDISKATKLKHLKIGDGTKGYSNSNFTSLSVGNNPLLEDIDIQNCPQFKQTLDLSGCDNIKSVKAKGSGATSVKLPDGGYLETLELPNSVSNLTIKKHTKFKTLSMDSYASLTTLWVEDTPNIPVEDIVNSATHLNRVRLTNINWSTDKIDTILKLAKCAGLDDYGNNTDTAWVTGTVTIDTLYSHDLDTIKSAFPYLTVKYNHLIHVVTFLNEDGSFLSKQEVEDNNNADTPPDPTKAYDKHYYYVFKGWDTTYTKVKKDLTIKATYDYITQTYHLKLYKNKSDSNPAAEVDVLYENTFAYDKSLFTTDDSVLAGWTNDDGTLFEDNFMFDSMAVINSAGNPVDIKLYAKRYTIELPSQSSNLSDLNYGQIKAVSNMIQGQTMEGASIKYFSDTREYIITNSKNGTTVSVAVGDVKDIVLRDGEPITLAVLDFKHDYQDLDESKGTGMTIGFKNLMAKTRQMNKGTKTKYNYTLGGVKADATTFSHEVSTEEAVSGYCELKANSQSYISLIKKESASGEVTTWAFDRRGFYCMQDLSGDSKPSTNTWYTADDDPNTYKFSKMLLQDNSAIDWMSTQLQKYAIQGSTTKFSDFGGMIIDTTAHDNLYNADSAVRFYSDYTNDWNNFTELTQNAIIKIPVVAGDTVTVYAYTSARNTNGYRDTDLRDYLINELYYLLPLGVRELIIPVVKKFSIGNRCPIIDYVIDPIWLLSSREVNGFNSDPYDKEGKVYPIFSNNESRKKYLANGTGDVYWWWLRGPGVGGSSYFCYVHTDGNPHHGSWANSSSGVSPSFCW